MGIIFKLEHANLISNLTYGNINAVEDYDLCYITDGTKED